VSWRFDHFLAEQKSFVPFVWREADSPYIDLSAGFDAYVAERGAAPAAAQLARKKRKLEREVGPARFVPHTTDRKVFEQVIAWKSHQFRVTGEPNIFDYPWVEQLLARILECEGEDFSPMLSVLYAGDRIAAATFSMRCRGTYHCWFPTYEAELARYSPGALLMNELMANCRELGISKIDLGKGPEEYKRRAATGAARVLEGTVDTRRGTALVRRAWLRTRDRIRSSPLYGPARVPARMLERVRSWFELR
jgi:CelD/BcsL family acetyltransferase involved in cellulose biosynthesis